MRYPALNISPKTGHEPFVSASSEAGGTLLDFWRWALSDVVSNTTRGWLAEYLVAKSLGIAEGVRSPWDAYDLRLSNGLTLEVKASSYLQAWAHDRLSQPAFSIAPSRAWEAEANSYAAEVRRQAHLYVFCLLAHQDQDTLNPLCLDQWEFYVVPTGVLNERHGSRKTLGLAAVRALAPAIPWSGIPAAIEALALGA